MLQGSFLQNKAKKKRFDDSGYDEVSPAKKSKSKKKDFSQERKSKRGEE